MARFMDGEVELIDRVVDINRVSKVVKGGRRFSFAAMVVVGNANGKVGWGYGKANEVPPSVEKATKQASREQVEVQLEGGTIPHVAKAECCFLSQHRLAAASTLSASS